MFETFRAFRQDLGRLDRVIVNAGLGKGQPIGTGWFRANRETAETNFVSALAQCEAAVEIFREQNAGHLVVISSVLAVRGFRGNITTYAATKAAVSSLAEGIRMDLMRTPIKVTTICPGYIRSEMNERVKNTPFIVDTETGCRAIVRAIEREALITASDFKKGVGALATIATTAPFIGLFGTVIGIINAFRGMAQSGAGGLGSVSAGIAEALVTTALGLFVAIPAVWLYNYFLNKIDRFQVEMSNSASELIDYFMKRQAARAA